MFSTNRNRSRILFLSLVAGPVLFHATIAHAATFTVTSTSDSGAGTLRQALMDAASGDTIRFSLPQGSVIGLMSGSLVINKNLTINGPGASLLNVRNINPDISANRFRIFTITSGGFNVAISGLTISNGNAAGSAGGGGGIFNQTGTLTITGCAISGNGVHNGQGGGIVNIGGKMNIINSSITGNVSYGGLFIGGGGIYNLSVPGYDSSVDISNSTISNNSAFEGYGGGIWNHNPTVSDGPPASGTVNVINCTISGNSAFMAGGVYNASGNTVNASNTIIAKNANFGGKPSPDFSGELTSQGYNFIGDSSGATITPAPGDQIGTAALPIDPLLGPLQDNGGPTQTQALLATSTAINAGNDATAPQRDQRGYVRSGVSDIGAFEFGGTIPVTLANISTRVQVGHNDDVLIAGFIITGSQPKKLLLRALGPSVQLSGVLSDPILTLYDSAGQAIATNDNWRTNSNAPEIEATGLAPRNNSESAILTSLTPGAYTAVVSGVNGAGVMFSPGIGLVEVYDLDRTVNSKLANISSRGLVQAGDNVMIAGVIVLGSDSQKVIVRALGPSIAVPGHLLDPTLDLRDSNGALIASNDNWRTAQEIEIAATGIPPTNNAESAIIRTLPPAPYTAIVRGANGTTGIALVEVYALN